mgnify:CR=1 FL=1
MAKAKNTNTWKINDRQPKKTRQGIGKLSKGHKKYRGQGGRRKRYKAQ